MHPRRDPESEPTEPGTEGRGQDPWPDPFDADLEPTWHAWQLEPPPDDRLDPVVIGRRSDGGDVVPKRFPPAFEGDDPPTEEVADPQTVWSALLQPEPAVEEPAAPATPAPPPVDAEPDPGPPMRFVEPTLDPDPEDGVSEAETVDLELSAVLPPDLVPSGLRRRLRVDTIRPDEPDQSADDRRSPRPGTAASSSATRTLRWLVVGLSAAVVVLSVALAVAILYVVSG